MKRLLLVDDEDDIREVAQLSLEVIGGWDVMTAASGAEGVALAEQHRPDAILLDVMMPGMDGPTTFKRLQANTATQAIPVILLTAKVQAADHRRFAELQVRGVLAKPFDPAALSSDVARLLGWSL